MDGCDGAKDFSRILILPFPTVTKFTPLVARSQSLRHSNSVSPSLVPLLFFFPFLPSPPTSSPFGWCVSSRLDSYPPWFPLTPRLLLLGPDTATYHCIGKHSRDCHNFNYQQKYRNINYFINISSFVNLFPNISKPLSWPRNSRKC